MIPSNPIKPEETGSYATVALLMASLSVDADGEITLATSSLDPVGVFSEAGLTTMIVNLKFEGGLEYEVEFSPKEGSLSRDVRTYRLAKFHPSKFYPKEMEALPEEPSRQEIPQEKVDRLETAYLKMVNAEIPITLSGLAIAARVSTDLTRVWADQYHPGVATLFPPRRQRKKAA